MSTARGPVFVLALVGAITLGAAVAYWLDREERRSGRATTGHEAPTAHGVAEPSGELRGPAEAPPVSRRTSGATPETAGSIVAPELPQGLLRGRVLDGSGRGLSGVDITLQHAEARAFDLRVLEPERTSVEVGHAQSGSDGSFRIPLEIGLPVDVHASREDLGERTWCDAYAGQELELTLVAGTLVHGTVTRARDGTPVVGARVRIRSEDPSRRGLETRSAADGVYALRVPALEDAHLEVVPDGLRPTGWIPLEPAPDGLLRYDVRLEDGCLATGTVRDARTGAPIAGATVGEGPWLRRATTTDARGVYRLEGFGDPGMPELGARAPGHGPALARAPEPVDGVVRLDFTLERGRALVGRVVDEAGRGLAGASVSALASAIEAAGQRIDARTTHTDARGEFVLDDLAADLGHALLVALRGYGTQVHDLPEAELDTSPLALGEIVLRPAGLVGGRVEDARGRPLAEIEVELAGANGDRDRLASGGPRRASGYVDRRRVRSDAAGRFWFGDVSAGRYVLVTRASGRPESAGLPLALTTGERREDLVLRLDDAGRLQGQVVDTDGAPLSGVFVSAQSERLLDPAGLPPGHVHVRTGADGRFELMGLPPGEYTLRAYALETPGADPDAPWLPRIVPHVETGNAGRTLTLERGSTIRGRLVDADGSPRSGFVVSTDVATEGSEVFATTDAEGRFELVVPRGPALRLSVRGGPDSEAFRRVLLEREGVAPGTRELVLVLP